MRRSNQVRRLWPAWSGAAVAVLLSSDCAAGRDARLSVGFDAHGPYAVASGFHAVVTQGALSRVVRGSSMQVVASADNYLAASRDDIRLRPNAPTTVDVHVAAAGGDVTERVSLTPQEDWEYSVAVVVNSRRPHGLCFNVVRATPLPAVAGAATDTLFVIQSGLPRGAIC